MTTTIKLLLLFAITTSFAQNQSTNKIINPIVESLSTDNSEIKALISASYNYLGLTIIPPDPNKIYAVEELENKPEFPGDTTALKSFIKENFVIPTQNGKKVAGTIFASFIIEKDGSVTDIGILHDYGHGSGDEAIRVLEKMPKWIAGKNDSSAVRCIYAMPIVCDGD